MDFAADNGWPDTVLVSTLPMTIEDPFPTSVTINGHTVTVATDANGDAVPGFYPLGSSTGLANAALGGQAKGAVLR